MPGSATKKDIVKPAINSNFSYIVIYNTRNQSIFDKNWYYKVIQE